MKFSLSARWGRGAGACLLWLSTTSLFCQMIKEDRNNHPNPQKIKKVEVLVRKPPFIFSPHLSYKEQQKMLLAKKKLGGITFIVKSRSIKNRTINPKQPNTLPNSQKLFIERKIMPDNEVPFIRYELTDTTDK